MAAVTRSEPVGDLQAERERVVVGETRDSETIAPDIRVTEHRVADAGRNLHRVQGITAADRDADPTVRRIKWRDDVFVALRLEVDRTQSDKRIRESARNPQRIGGAVVDIGDARATRRK
ncbi:MAG: hypothetical protein ACK56I_35185, partial [bacterium]